MSICHSLKSSAFAIEIPGGNFVLACEILLSTSVRTSLYMRSVQAMEWAMVGRNRAQSEVKGHTFCNSYGTVSVEHTLKIVRLTFPRRFVANMAGRAREQTSLDLVLRVGAMRQAAM